MLLPLWPSPVLGGGEPVGQSHVESKNMPKQPRVEIEYCTQCRWLLRAAWMAQELLTTFAADLGEVALQPGRGGVFEVRVDGETVWSRAAQGRFPEARNSSNGYGTAWHLDGRSDTRIALCVSGRLIVQLCLR